MGSLPRIPLLVGRLASIAVIAAVFPWLMAEYDRTANLELVLLEAFPALIIAGIAAAGCLLVGEGWPARVGRTEHCASCGHPWVPEDHILLNHCQECGACWRWFGGRVVGAPHFRPWLLVAGASLLLLVPGVLVAESVGAFSALSQRSSKLLLRSVETGLSAHAVRDLELLIDRAAGDPSLNSRIATAVLNRRAANGSLPHELTAWMNSSIAGSVLTAADTDRWYSEMIEFRVDLPAIVTAGEDAPYIIAARFKGGWEDVADVPQIALGGFIVGEGAAPVARSPYVTPAQSLVGWQELDSGRLTAPDDPGIVTVTWRAWLIIGRPLQTVTFDVEGRPDVPPGATLREYVWTRPMEVVRSEPATEPAADRTAAP